MSDPTSIPVGPLGQAVSLNDGGGLRTHGGGKGKQGANPLVVLRRTAFTTWTEDRCQSDDRAIRRLLHWADQSNLGQDSRLIARALARRTRSLRALADAGHTVVRLHARVQWRLAAGVGAKDNAHEIGIALHGTYGWPVLFASGLKGMTAAWAAQYVSDTAAIGHVFGTPRPTGTQDRTPPADSASEDARGAEDGSRARASRGGVLFLDALPIGVAPVERDVLTPHVQPYYRTAEANRTGETVRAEPPAEHHNPVPVTFLTVRDATFTIDLAGRDAKAVHDAAAWLANAADELGAGAKTSAGYGYLHIEPDPDWRRDPAPCAKD